LSHCSNIIDTLLLHISSGRDRWWARGSKAGRESEAGNEKEKRRGRQGEQGSKSKGVEASSCIKWESKGGSAREGEQGRESKGGRRGREQGMIACKNARVGKK
jgi:hypothetical protein